MSLVAASAAPTALLGDVPVWASGAYSMTVDKRERTFLLDVPVDLKPGAPLVMVFHGTGSSAVEARRDYGFTPLVEKHGFVAVYPDATRDTNADRARQFHVDYAFQRNSAVDDVRFARELSRRLVEDLRLDDGAVFATGMSNGGDMSYLLACQRDPFAKAVAPVAGSMMVSWGQNLRPGARTSVLAVHSRDDDVTLWAGDLENQDGWGAYFGVEASLKRWVNAFALEPLATTAQGTPLREGLRLREWRSSNDDTEVRLYEFDSLGHNWPPALGDEGVTTAEEIWRFFDAHRAKTE